MKLLLLFLYYLFFTLNSRGQPTQGDPALTEIWRPVPVKVTPGNISSNAPSDAIILFAVKKDTANWLGKNEKPFSWKSDDSSLTVIPFAGDLHSKQGFGDCQLHIEWRTPALVKGDGQGRVIVVFF